MSIELEEQYDCIYRYCYYRLHHIQLAEDITQEVFLRYFAQGNLERGRPLPYLYTIARNLCIDEFRKKKTGYIEDCFEKELPENIGGDQQDALIETMALKQALMELTDDEREMVVLRYVNEVSVADMAEIFQVSRFAMYRKLKGVLKKLKGNMQGG